MFDHIARNLFLELFHKKRPFRPRPHQAHLPGKNIKKLRKLVQAGLPQYFTHLGHPGVALHRPSLLLLGRLLHLHRAELVHIKRLIMQPDSFLFKNNRSRAGSLHKNSGYQHNRRRNDQPHKRTYHINRPLRNPVQRVCQRHISYINDRQSHQIFGIRSAWHDTVIIRDKLRMDAGFFAQIHDALQTVIIFQRQSNGNLIQFIFRQDVQEIFDLAQHLNAFVQCAARHPVIQYPSYHISPLRISIDSGNIFLRCPGISH